MRLRVEEKVRVKVRVRAVTVDDATAVANVGLYEDAKQHRQRPVNARATAE
jgi:hypothetical protein